jgi:hypothetical protein
MRQRAFLGAIHRDTGRDENDIVTPVEKPDKKSLGTIVGPDLRAPRRPLRDAGRGVELASFS